MKTEIILLTVVWLKRKQRKGRIPCLTESVKTFSSLLAVQWDSINLKRWTHLTSFFWGNKNVRIENFVLIAYFRVAVSPSIKSRPGHNHSYQNKFNFHVNEIAFWYETMGTKTRFEKEALKGNSGNGQLGTQLSNFAWKSKFSLKKKSFVSR